MAGAAAPAFRAGEPQPLLSTGGTPPSDGSDSGSAAAAATVVPSPRPELPGFVNGLVSNFFPTEAGSGIADGLFPNVVPVPSSPGDDEWVATEAGLLPLSYALQPSGASGGAADLTASLAAAVNDTLAGVGDVFVFSYGVIVSWGLSESAEQAFIAQMRSFEIGSLEGGAENEIFDYGYLGGVYGPGGGEEAPPGIHTHPPAPAAASTASTHAAASAAGGDGAHGARTAVVDASVVRIAQDTVLLSLALAPDDLVQAKLAVSHAVAQSSKLASFESAVEGVFERIAHLPVALAQTGRLNISDRELLRLSGELYTYRAYINLQTDILDTPDYFWDHEELEPLYHKGSGYLDIARRTSVLNTRLDVIADLYALFRDERHVQKGHRLEWIVIYLIVIEIVLDLLELVVLGHGGV